MGAGLPPAARRLPLMLPAPAVASPPAALPLASCPLGRRRSQR